MRVTRTQTGKLPLKVIREEVVSDYESPPPSPRASSASPPVVDYSVEVIPKKPTPVFQTFKTNTKIEGGLAIVRDLGGGKYEIVNVKHISHNAFSSEETGLIIKADKKRRDAINLSKEDWAEVAFKCAMAVGSADKTIFRFRKLPIELRYRVYDFAIIGVKPFRRYRQGCGDCQLELALGLRQVSREIYEETKPFFYKNSFQLGNETTLSTSIPKICLDNLKEVTFEWSGLNNKQKQALSIIRLQLKNVKILNLYITRWIFCPGQALVVENTADNTVKKFAQIKGFYEISAIRGLDVVRVFNEGPSKALEENVSPADVKALENYLTKKLTHPKWTPAPATAKKGVKVKMTKKAAALAKKARKAKASYSEDDSDYEG